MTAEKTTTKRPVVFVVGDDESIRMMSRTTLEQSGFSVEEAADGLEALSLLKEWKPDLILLDVMMTGMDGIKVCSELRKMPGGERIPVLMITGMNDLESIQCAYDAGATDFMTKPINWIILSYRLMYMLRTSENFSHLMRMETRNSALLKAIPDAMFQIDSKGIFLDFKSNFDLDLLVMPEKVIGRKVNDVLPEGLAASIAERVEIASVRGDTQIFEHHVTGKGPERYFEIRLVVCGVNEILVLMRDITKRKQAENRIRYIAYHDPLTHLPNMILFRDHLTRSLASARHSGKLVAVLFVDLDRFKVINDTLGHKVGDLLLQAVADRFINGMRRGDIVAHLGGNDTEDLVARMGGDEFTILLADIKKPDDAAKVSSRILEEIAKPFFICSQKLFITASIGIALYPADGYDMDTLIRNADTAMYHAKIRGRNNFQFFDDSMNLHIRERLSVENRVKMALKDREFTLHYQPRNEMSSGKILGVEALLRWYPSDIITIPVDQVISVAGDIGVITSLGKWILQTACRQVLDWQKAGLRSCISINLSVYEFKKRKLIANIRKLVGETRIDPSCLGFEITENTIMKDVEATTAILKEMKDLGINISVDNFGIGYSSLSLIRRLPINSLKIANVLIRDMITDQKDAEVVNAIITLAHSLKLKVVADGVENKEQFSILREFGCDEFQGFLYSPAVAASDVTRLLIGQKNNPLAGSSDGKR